MVVFFSVKVFSKASRFTLMQQIIYLYFKFRNKRIYQFVHFALFIQNDYQEQLEPFRVRWDGFVPIISSKTESWLPRCQTGLLLGPGPGSTLCKWYSVKNSLQPPAAATSHYIAASIHGDSREFVKICFSLVIEKCSGTSIYFSTSSRLLSTEEGKMGEGRLRKC